MTQDEAVNGAVSEEEELVIAEVRTLEPARPAASPAVLAAAGATAGFTLGAVVIALARHHQNAKTLKRARRGRANELVEVVSSRSFMVDVHLLGSLEEVAVGAAAAPPRAAGSSAGGAGRALCEVRVEVCPPWAFRLPLQNGADGVLKRRGRALQRLLHVDGEPVVAGVIQAAPDRVVFAARAASREHAEVGVERMRFAVGVDDDLREFHARFRSDPLIGPAVRRDPAKRARRRPFAFEALAWAVTEQLIEFSRALEIQRALVRRHGRRCPDTGLRDLPDAAVVAGLAPARLESFGLSAKRSLTLLRAAREVARGRIDLEGPDHERAWRRLRSIPGIGSWTVETTALYGQGRYDQLPAGDLEYVKLVGPLIHGRPRARATEDEVREFFAPYEEWQGLAGLYLRPALALRGSAEGRSLARVA